MMSKVRRLMLAAALSVFGLGGSVEAQEQPARLLQGTLKKIAASGTVTIGHRENAFPFSFVDRAGRPRGYSIDLCAAIVEQIGREIDRPALRMQYKPVSAEDRIARLVAGDIDLECGSSTNTAERQPQVAFSPVTFVTGTKLMVRRSSGIRSYRDLKGKVVVTTAGTTNDEALRHLDRRLKIAAEIVSEHGYEAAFQRIARGKADAFAADDVLLHGLIARHGAQRSFMVVGDFLSYEPYGIMFRKNDEQLAETVLQAFRRMAENGELYEYYHRWFIRRSPTGVRLNMPMTSQLTEIFRVLGAPD